VAGAHFDWSEVLAAGGSLSLFADARSSRSAFPRASPARTAAGAAATGPGRRGNDSTLTLVILPRLDKATRTGAWFARWSSTA
jgi:DNA polymerase-3 subunit delta